MNPEYAEITGEWVPSKGDGPVRLAFRSFDAPVPWPFRFVNGQIEEWRKPPAAPPDFYVIGVDDLPEHIRIKLVAARLENA